MRVPEELTVQVGTYRLGHIVTTHRIEVPSQQWHHPVPPGAVHQFIPINPVSDQRADTLSLRWFQSRSRALQQKLQLARGTVE
jgi:hypothetical protein